MLSQLFKKYLDNLYLKAMCFLCKPMHLILHLKKSFRERVQSFARCQRGPGHRES